MLLTRLLCLAGLVALTTAETPLLLVVGDVTNTHARVLVEWVSPEKPQSLNVWLFSEFLSASQINNESLSNPPTTSFLASNVPQIIILDGLTADRNYTAVFGSEALGVVDAVTFSTHELTSERILAFSCDRYLEDNDDEFVSQLAEAEHRRYSLAIHMGDQIYADQIVTTHSQASFEVALRAFRQLYRRAWTRPAMSAILRHGAHLMVPDDHDILNALTPNSIPGPESDFVLAGRRAVYEYQLQLARDIPADPKAYVPLHQFHRRGHLALALLDLRFHRAFFDEPAHPLLGQVQHDDLATHLRSWVADTNVAQILIVTCVPMLFPHPFLAKVADWFERERYSTHASLSSDTHALLALVSGAAAKKPVTAIAGDLHMFCNETVCNDRGDCFNALVSSGLTRRSSALRAPHLFLYDVFAYFALRSHLPALGDHAAWSTTIHQVKLINNYLILDTSDLTASPSADSTNTSRLHVTSVLRQVSTLDQVLLFLFDWAIFPIVSILAWVIVLIVRALWTCARKKKRAGAAKAKSS